MYIENFLTPNYHQWILSEVESKNTSWEFVGNTAYYGVENGEWDFSWAHMVYFDKQPRSKQYPLWLPVLMQICDTRGIELKEILRIRLGCYTKTPERIVHTPHIDFEFPHYTALYYINESDGDTLMYDQEYDYSKAGELYSEDYKPEGGFTIKESHSPKANSVFAFNGKHYHSSSSPVNSSRRLVCSFNFLAE